MNLVEEKRKIDEILKKDYDHEIPDTLRSKDFQKAFKSLLKKMFPECKIITNSTWCEAHGFVKTPEGKCVFYNTNDYRWRPWDRNILIRTAKDEKDYKGGGNHYANLEELQDQINWLFTTQTKKEGV